MKCKNCGGDTHEWCHTGQVCGRCHKTVASGKTVCPECGGVMCGDADDLSDHDFGRHLLLSMGSKIPETWICSEVGRMVRNLNKAGDELRKEAYAWKSICDKNNEPFVRLGEYLQANNLGSPGDHWGDIALRLLKEHAAQLARTVPFPDLEQAVKVARMHLGCQITDLELVQRKEGTCTSWRIRKARP